MIGQNFDISSKSFTINTFNLVSGETSIIHLHHENTDVFFRPSGTGPGVRIYIFGPEHTAKSDLEEIKAKIDQMFLFFFFYSSIIEFGSKFTPVFKTR